MQLAEFAFNPTSDELDEVEERMAVRFPAEYRAFMRSHDGGEGFVGEHYLVLWRASELERFNREYEFPVYAPEFVAFGSNGGGEAFAFDRRSQAMPIVVVPFIGMSHADGIVVADDFDQLLERMASKDVLF